ncbi:MAG TPA: response regulator transcription factor [Alphaproteobacteria bacterium]|nr:response regulator transcription factor [Alphaproteobacteria bacterium]
MRLLLIEDDKMISESLNAALRESGYAVDVAGDGQTGRLSLENQAYDLVLLDLGLPDGSGLDILKFLRDRRNQTPVLIVTAHDTLKDVVAGLDQGADDYMIKPFALEELEARVRVLLRRSQGRAAPVITWGNIRLDPSSHGLDINGHSIVLSAREFSILHALMEKPEAVLSRHQLEEKIYGWNEEVESNAIEYHISQLRKKIGCRIIRNIRGVGYTLEKKA